MTDFLRRWIELPPLWLALGLALAWALDRWAPVLRWDGVAPLWAGGALIVAGICLMVWSAIAFARAKTTLAPRREASALVTSGPYALSRNPIYLGDAMILIGWALSLGGLSALLVAPLFVWIIDRRFIAGEEAMLRASFPAAYAAWAARTRRWI